jgi:hypothetical protein
MQANFAEEASEQIWGLSGRVASGPDSDWLERLAARTMNRTRREPVEG